MVGQRTLTPLILVRIQVPEPVTNASQDYIAHTYFPHQPERANQIIFYVTKWGNVQFGLKNR